MIRDTAFQPSSDPRCMIRVISRAPSSGTSLHEVPARARRMVWTGDWFRTVSFACMLTQNSDHKWFTFLFSFKIHDYVFIVYFGSRLLTSTAYFFQWYYLESRPFHPNIENSNNRYLHWSTPQTHWSHKTAKLITIDHSFLSLIA